MFLIIIHAWCTPDFIYIDLIVSGVFLVPYFLILVVCGVPLLYMELSIGQFTRRGPIGALGQMCPLLKGKWISYDVIDC